MSGGTPTWPEITDDHPLYILHAELGPEFAGGTHKIWGITLSDKQEDFLTKIILQKFLRANGGNKDLAKAQLEETLKWREEYFDESGNVKGKWDESKFEDLAYITKETVKDGESHKEVTVTWNIYGNVKDFVETFGDVEEFLRWRVNLMECSIKLLDLPSAKEPIPDYDPNKPTVDPYQAIQVHDYLSVSFFRTPPDVRKASGQTVQLFQKYYPELLDKKFFVNVPFIMGWVYTAMKALVAKETFRKLTMLSNGKDLNKYMESDTIPDCYGGNGKPLKKAQEADSEDNATPGAKTGAEATDPAAAGDPPTAGQPGK